MSDSRYRPNKSERVIKRQRKQDYSIKRYSQWKFRRARAATN